MNKEFCSYEQSLELKELGFDEPCFGYWNIDPYLPKPTFNLVKPFDHEWCVPAPLKQQVFRWFREKHNLNGILNHYPNTKLWDFSVHNLLWNGKEFIEHVRKEDRSVKYSTYEEAEDACINHCIKIIKLLKLK